MRYNLRYDIRERSDKVVPIIQTSLEIIAAAVGVFTDGD
jgi:hypothetical protein